MTPLAPANPVELALLERLFSAATTEASAAMCRWTSGLVTLALDEVLDLPLAEALRAVPSVERPMNVVAMTLGPDAESGAMILAFDDADGRELASALIGAPPADPDAPWSELEVSALMETGNILGCAYLNGLLRLADVELAPSPPYFMQDYLAGVLQPVLALQALDSDRVLLVRTTFRRAGRALEWHVFFLPSRSLRRTLDHALSGK